MKKSIGALVIWVCIVMFSCSSNEDKKTVVTDSKYKIFEDDVMKLINAHRISLGLKPYIVSDYISSQAAEHVDYMIQKNSINHDGFFDRAANISKTLGSSTTGENVEQGKVQQNRFLMLGWIGIVEEVIKII